MMQDWFRNAKLGIFIHYGIYAVGDVSESWSFHNGNISYEDYMKQCEGFTASKFDAKKWAELFQKAGAQYVVMTAKHHDGVALFDTGYSDLSVVKKTPAARDLVKEYTAAMREAGLKVGLYYSLIDWSDPRYRTVYPEGMKKEDCLNDIYGSPAGKEEEPEKWQEFLEFNNHQLKELMSNYGTVDLLWFDGDWERSAAQWKMPEFREYLHTLNPNVVLNSRMQGYGDYETPEQGIPLYGPKGEWEFCTTINDSWGYRPSDNDYKSSGQIVRMFCDCITLGGRMLLDIGPKEDGTLDEIMSNYIGDEVGQHPYESPADVDRSNGTLTMATNAEFEPWEYKEGNDIVGIDADISKAICDKLGYELKIEDMSFETILASVNSGKADFGAAGMTVTPEREESVDFTDTYADATQVVIVRK